MVRSAFTSRDSASEVQEAQNASMVENAQQPVPPAASSASASGVQGGERSCSPDRAPPRKPWRLPFMSVFAADEPDEAASSSDEAPQRAKDLPVSSAVSAEPSPVSAPPQAHAAGQQGKPSRMVPSAFAAAEPDGEARPDTAASASAPEQVRQRQQPRRPGVSAFAESPLDQQRDPVQPKTRPYLVSAFANDDLAGDAPRQQQRRGPPTQGCGTGAAEVIELSERGSPGQEPDMAAPEGRKAAPQLVKSPFHQEG